LVILNNCYDEELNQNYIAITTIGSGED